MSDQGLIASPFLSVPAVGIEPRVIGTSREIPAIAVWSAVVVAIASAVILSVSWRANCQGDCEYCRQSGDAGDTC